MNRIVATIDDLPVLPFEKVLSYLNLGDRLKARAVSQGWRKKFDSYPVKSLCYAERPLDFIYEKRRMVSGAYAFISSTKFDSFFSNFGQSILSNLKRLRFCSLGLDEPNAAAFASTINSFGQLEELSIIRFKPRDSPSMQFELNLPMLTSFQLERADAIKELTLDAPRLREVKLAMSWSLNLVIVRGESVERLLTDRLRYTEVENLKNLQQIYTADLEAIDSTFLSGLNQLKEVHTMNRDDIAELFEQKQLYGRTDLKIYLCGFLLNGPDDPAISSLSAGSDERLLVQLAQENPSRLAAKIPFFRYLHYSAIEGVHPEVAIDFVNRCTDLSLVIVDRPVQDIERFLDVLKNCENIVVLSFRCDQPQDLFDRLPDHSALQSIAIDSAVSPNLEFLRRLKDLIDLDVSFSIDAELIRNLFQELPYLSDFGFMWNNQDASIDVIRDSGWTNPERFKVWCGAKRDEVPDLEDAIQFLVQTEPQASGQPQ